MAISPYSTPLQYEYKPLNLSGFMLPLAEMQKDFDATTAAVDEADFNIANLPYGTDPEKAKELMATVKAKRDELAQNLATTKNYRQAASKLKQLNTLWNKDPHKLALESNAKLWAKRDAEELARINNGKKDSITREDYEQWKADEIRKYSDVNKGASFTADYNNEEGKYNVITGNVGRLADKTDELRELSMKAAAAMKANASEGYYKSIGIDSDTFHKHFAKTNVEELTQEEVARDVRAFLLTQPDFKDWGMEKADYNFKDIQYSKNYNEYAKNIVSVEKQDVTDALTRRKAELSKAKKSLESDETYQSLLKKEKELSNMETTGEYDPNKVKSIYTKQHLDNLFDMNAVGELYEYRKVSTSEKSEKIDDDSALGMSLGTSKANQSIPFVGKVEDMKFNTPSIYKNIVNNAKVIRATTGKLFATFDGSMRALALGKRDSKERLVLEKNAGAQYERLVAIQDAVVNSNGNYVKFKENLRKRGITDIDDKHAKKVFEGLSSDKSGSLAQLKEGIRNSEHAYQNYVVNKQNVINIEKATYKDETFKAVTGEIGSQTPSVEGGVPTVTQGGEVHYQQVTPLSFQSKTYSKEKLQKAGINPNKEKLTFDDVAKLNGFKNYKEAVQEGHDFGGVKVSAIVNGKSYYGTAQEIKKQLVKETGQKGLNVEKMANKFINDEVTEKELKNTFTNMQSVIQNASASELAGLPGFDEQGNPLSGTVTSKLKPQIVTLAGETYISVPYNYANTTEGKVAGQGNVLLKTGPHNKAYLENMYNRVLTKAKNNPNSLGEETIDTARVGLFNVKFGNGFNDVIANSPSMQVKDAPGYREREITSVTIPLPNGRSSEGTIVKKTRGNGSTDSYYTIKYPDGTYLKEQFKTPDALKAKIMEYNGY